MNVDPNTGFTQFGNSITFHCNGANPCYSDWYTYAGTGHTHQMKLLVKVVTIDSTVPSNSPGHYKYDQAEVNAGIFNYRGEAYPLIYPLFYGVTPLSKKVPFPSLPYYDCQPSFRIQGSPTCPIRAEEERPVRYFSDIVQDYYNNQNPKWPLPDANTRCSPHHIKPVRWGGPSTGDNGVFVLNPSEHQPFSRWWSGFLLNR